MKIAKLIKLTLPVLALLIFSMAAQGTSQSSETEGQGLIRCANLIYGQNKSSVCFSDEFLVEIQKETNIRTHRRFSPVKLGSADLFDHPFSVMTGEGAFSLTTEQRTNLRDYLELGGFVVASAGCSSKSWNESFKREIGQVLPDHELVILDADHPVYHTVYDIKSSKYKSSAEKLPELYGLEIDGRMVLIWSPDGLNDTANAGPSCCCCGGNEVKAARAVNVNLLAYALTH